MSRKPDPLLLSQVRGFIVCLAILILSLSYLLWKNPQTVPDMAHLPMATTEESDPVDKLDPNKATAEELGAIPRLGLKRAAAIVRYRTAYRANHPGKSAFRRVEDLRAIRGIGPATVELLKDYLVFSEEDSAMSAGTTVPASSR